MSNHLSKEKLAKKQKAVRRMMDLMISNRWQHGMHRKAAEHYGVSPHVAALWATEAGVRVNAVIDRFWVTQKFGMTVAELERVAYQCEIEQDRRAQVVALKALGQLLLRVVGDETDTSDAAQATREKLVAAGWTPPTSLPGLPSPMVSTIAECVVEKPSYDQSDNERDNETCHASSLARKTDE